MKYLLEIFLNCYWKYIIDKYKLTPDKIFNVDETGMTTVPKSLPKIIGTKGKKQIAKQWLRSNAGRVITQFQIAELVGKAFEKAATIPTAHNAFRATGIWPPDPKIFTEADFIAADTTNIQINDANNSFKEPSPCRSTLDADDVPLAQLRMLPEFNSPSTSSFILSPESIMPVPKTNQIKRASKIGANYNFITLPKGIRRFTKDWR